MTQPHFVAAEPSFQWAEQALFDMPERPDWQHEGACVGVDPDLFYPNRGAPTGVAQRVCAGCAVRVECLEYALTNNEHYGIWGGMSERQRQRIRRGRRLDRRAS